MKSIFSLLVILGSLSTVHASATLAPQPSIPQAGHYSWAPTIRLSVPYRIETMDLRTVAGTDRMKALKASGAVCEIIQSTGRCRIKGGTLSPAQHARATTLARDILNRNFGAGAPLVVASEPTQIKLISEAPQLTQYEVAQAGSVAGRTFKNYSIFILGDGTQKIQISEWFWFRAAPTLVHGFILNLQEQSQASSQVSWTVLAEAALLNTFE